MKKCSITTICILVLSLALLCSGCSAILQRFDNPEIRQRAEAMLDALIEDDYQAAYQLASHLVSQEDFWPAYQQMKALLDNASIYDLKLLSIYTNSTISNGQKRSTKSAVYEMTTDYGKIIVDITTTSDNYALEGFYLTPYENTDYYSTGTLENMKDANAVQWIMLLSNLLAIGISVFAIVDCCRHKIKNKVLWLLLPILGFFTVGATILATGFRFNFNIGWITAYSALIRYGSGTLVVRFMLPFGAVIYFALRQIILKKSTPPTVPCKSAPCVHTEIPSQQQVEQELADSPANEQA